MLPEKITLPTTLLAGAHIVAASSPTLISLDYSLRRSIFVAEGAGTVRPMPAAEGSIALLLAGVPPPEPMTLGVTIFDLSDGRRVFVCSEVVENRGVSVTNAWPELASLLLRGDGGVKAEQAVFVEHYFQGSYRSDKKEETFDLVEITWDGSRPVHQMWRRIKES